MQQTSFSCQDSRQGGGRMGRMPGRILTIALPSGSFICALQKLGQLGLSVLQCADIVINVHAL